MTPPRPQPHYHWVWCNTIHGGKNIDIFEGRTHVAITFSESEAKRIIAALRATHTPAAPAERHLTYTVGECMTQCQKARDDEREQVLDELLQWLEGHWTLTMVKHYGALTTQQSLEYKTTINKIKSLRGGADELL